MLLAVLRICRIQATVRDPGPHCANSTRCQTAFPGLQIFNVFGAS